MTYQHRAHQLRQDTTRHYNCCQAVLLPFAEAQGLNCEQALLLAAPFGGGMRRGAVCGAVTGGLMALGLMGADDDTVAAFQQRFCQQAGDLDCAALLAQAQARGEEKKPYCDGMVALAVALAEQAVAP